MSSDQQITPELLLRAYSVGVFPMAEHRDDPDIFWVDPTLRGILPIDGLHISRSLAKHMRKTKHYATINANFAAVVDGCANRAETWISDRIRMLYLALHGRGHAHSLEIWQDGALAGGVYGVAIGSAFFGESMFSTRPNGSKMALAWLVAHLQNTGYTLFDTQFLTPHLESMGAREIPRAEYHNLLDKALRLPADINSRPVPRELDQVLQRMTQTS